MKLPRLRYTYVVFYAIDYGDTNGEGWKRIERKSIVNTTNDIYDSQKEILDSNSQYKNICITNYKLLSVRVVWE